MFLSFRMPFGMLGAFFLRFRDPIFAAQKHRGKPSWYFESIMGDYFSTSGPPWRTMGAGICFWSSDCLKRFLLFASKFFFIYMNRNVNVRDFPTIVSHDNYYKKRFSVAIVRNDFRNRVLLCIVYLFSNV